MALPTSYVTSTKNVSAILAQMQKGGIPQKFTYDHLKQMGFPSSNDRPIIPILKALGYLDPSGTPLERYRRFKGTSEEAKRVMAEAIRDAYADVFAIDETAHTLSADTLKGIFGRLSGKSDAVATKMALTFRALADHADFSLAGTDELPEDGADEEQEDGDHDDAAHVDRLAGAMMLRHDVHVHLPVSDDIKVYDAIFRSLRDNLLP